ncbi:uncharacterized protein EV422DRAFT_565045 [Fimicolochytrium jonesii]|uniref:uncharacterized protein n=1 Tax=Fimicolochytrium jonesii TaxID=1396493 RepID=UPI0022FDE795|nr:uncharacterized protein EV422DRAFT_565045 [Fimicolochytrium jonesii]KAI8824349.1 hypothetical protein EV422DRAFT_565045 [Fimicolochytrium jonesii]
MHEEKSKDFLQKDILEASPFTEAVKVGSLGVFAGALSSAAFQWWIAAPRHEVLKEAGRGAGFFGVAGAAFYGTQVAVAQFREKDDMWNAPVGGAVVGALIGLRSGKLSHVVAHSIFLPIIIAGAEWARLETSLARGEKKPDDGFFKWPRRDPYKQRWEEIQKKDQEKGAAI